MRTKCNTYCEKLNSHITLMILKDYYLISKCGKLYVPEVYKRVIGYVTYKHINNAPTLEISTFVRVDYLTM